MVDEIQFQYEPAPPLVGELSAKLTEGAAQVSNLCNVSWARWTARTPSASATLQHLPRFAVEEFKGSLSCS